VVRAVLAAPAEVVVNLVQALQVAHLPQGPRKAGVRPAVAKVVTVDAVDMAAVAVAAAGARAMGSSYGPLRPETARTSKQTTPS